MAATTAQVVSMIEELQQEEFVQKGRRKREESERQVGVFKRGQSV
jgi:hypothetical protein